jgi:hypothetical protein
MNKFKARVRCVLLGALLAPMLALASGVIITDGGPSGEFFDNTRNGEGFFVEVARVGDVIVFAVSMFTFDENGNEMWLTGSVVLEEGATTATVTMLRATTGTPFGPAFDQDDVELTVWGVMIFHFPTCNTMLVPYGSPDFGAGVFDHGRLTQLVGVVCEEKEPPVQPPDLPSEITPGTWVGVDVCFNVSQDGTSLTPVGSVCDGERSFDLHKEGASFGKGNVGACVVDLDTELVIPIVDGAFAFAEADSATIGGFSGPASAIGDAAEAALADVCVTGWSAEPL